MRSLLLELVFIFSLSCVGLFKLYESFGGKVLNEGEETSSGFNFRRRLNSLPSLVLDPKSIEYKAIHKSHFFNIDHQHVGEILHYCSQNNQIMNRMNQNYRQWDFSLTVNDFKQFHDRQCDTSKDILSAVEMGVRKWDDPIYNSAVEAEKERHPSFFVPHECNIPSIPTQQACGILSQFSHIVFSGDSLMRHIRQALFIILRNHNLVVGGINTSNSTAANMCTCDGQFSENLWCRLNDGVFNGGTNNEMGVCLDNPNSGFVYKRYEHNVDGDYGHGFWDNIDCADPNQGSVLLVLLGGLHFKVDADSTYKLMLEPHINNPQFQQCMKYHKLVPIFIGYNTQSLEWDQYHPNQGRENGARFNKRMKELLKSSGIYFLDILNFTKEARGSDGVHKLMDVNLMLMYFILNLADNLLLESNLALN